MKHGDFTRLAKHYSAYRPAYSESILTAALSLCEQPISRLHIADVGAGTGIWTRMLARQGPASVIAVEPNVRMRRQGVKDSRGLSIRWQTGRAERTHLQTASCDMVTMASSFHWAKFASATREIHRILKAHGRFVALWNPRLMSANHTLQRIEAHLNRLKPNLKRVSSGLSVSMTGFRDQLLKSKLFEDVVYMEALHTAEMPVHAYLGAWESTNDIPVQLGPKKFREFLDHMRRELLSYKTLRVVYLTRAWSARKRS